MVGTVYKNLQRHLTQILNKWEGETITISRQTPQTDKLGKVVGLTTTTFTVLGTLGSIPLANENSIVGWLSSSNHSGLFLGSALQNKDRMMWKGYTYEVVKIHYLLDLDTVVATTAELMRIPGDGT